MKIQAVPFKGAFYMCVEDSPRAKLIREADIAWKMGYNDLCEETRLKAMDASGCAFEAREEAAKEAADQLENQLNSPDTRWFSDAFARMSVDIDSNGERAYHDACFEGAIGDVPSDGFGYDE